MSVVTATMKPASNDTGNTPSSNLPLAVSQTLLGGGATSGMKSQMAVKAGANTAARQVKAPVGVGSGAGRLVGAAPQRKERRSMMTTVEEFEWQPLVTIGQRNSETIQHESLWLDTRGATRVIVQILALSLVNNLKIETAETLDGEWFEAVDHDSTNLLYSQAILSRDLPRSDSSRLRRYLRWKFASGAGDHCFRLRVQLIL